MAGVRRHQTPPAIRRQGAVVRAASASKRARFPEAHAASQLDHENIVINDSASQRRPFFVMERCATGLTRARRGTDGDRGGRRGRGPAARALALPTRWHRPPRRQAENIFLVQRSQGRGA
jgi:hypothetical protein